MKFICYWAQQAILEGCCDGPVLVSDAACGSKSGIIQDADLLLYLSSIWLDSISDSSLLIVFFSSLLALLQDEHPHREFNLLQLNRVNFVSILLNFCKVSTYLRMMYVCILCPRLGAE